MRTSLIPSYIQTKPQQFRIAPSSKTKKRPTFTPPHWGVHEGLTISDKTTSESEMTIASRDIALWTHGKTITLALATPVGTMTKET